MEGDEWRSNPLLHRWRPEVRHHRALRYLRLHPNIYMPANKLSPPNRAERVDVFRGEVALAACWAAT